MSHRHKLKQQKSSGVSRFLSTRKQKLKTDFAWSDRDREQNATGLAEWTAGRDRAVFRGLFFSPHRRTRVTNWTVFRRGMFSLCCRRLDSFRSRREIFLSQNKQRRRKEGRSLSREQHFSARWTKISGLVSRQVSLTVAILAVRFYCLYFLMAALLRHVCSNFRCVLEMIQELAGLRMSEKESVSFFLHV